MAHTDSLNKIIGTYFACVTAEPFEYKNKMYFPKTLRVSPGIFRGYTCPEGCGGCCPRFSLDYLPEEPKPESPFIKERLIRFNGREVPIFSDLQDDHAAHHCRNLEQSNGRCRIHGVHPFSCDFELTRFMEFADARRPNGLTTKLYGRGWALLRVDGERGAKCEITPANAASTADLVRKLRRLELWCSHFGLSTKLPQLIDWCESGPHDSPLV